ncbi:MAG: hypothetical protein ACREED_08370, partial [Stellaceae bacterium]
GRPSFALLPGEPGYVAGGSDEEVGDSAPPRSEPIHDTTRFGAEPQPGHESTRESTGHPGQGEEGRHRRRRGRRGGRRRRGRGGEQRNEPMTGNAASEPSAHETETFTPPAERYAPPVETPPPAPRVANPEPAPEPAPAEAERQPIQHNVPPAHDVTGPSGNPKKGWWRR